MEDAFAAEIEPLLLAIAKRCSELGVPFVAVSEISRRSVSTTKSSMSGASHLMIGIEEAAAHMLDPDIRMETPLKRCPFCFALAEMTGWYAVRCSNPDCAVQPCTRPFDTEAQAIEAWNVRGPDYVRKARAEIVKRLSDIPIDDDL